MSAFLFKILALTAMIIDHVGAVFFPQYVWLRYIGRISMPIYAFLLSEGYQHTKNFNLYALRLTLFAILSEVPYDLLFHNTYLEFGTQNILFTLLAALIVIRLLDEAGKRQNIFLFLLAAAVTYAAEFLGFSYGYYGVLVPVAFYLFRKYKGFDLLAFAGVTYANYLHDNNRIQLYAIAACVPLMLYNGKRGKYSWKYFFYAAYPLHLLILWLVHYIL